MIMMGSQDTTYFYHSPPPPHNTLPNGTAGDRGTTGGVISGSTTGWFFCRDGYPTTATGGFGVGGNTVDTTSMTTLSNETGLVHASSVWGGTKHHPDTTATNLEGKSAAATTTTSTLSQQQPPQKLPHHEASSASIVMARMMNSVDYNKRNHHAAAAPKPPRSAFAIFMATERIRIVTRHANFGTTTTTTSFGHNHSPQDDIPFVLAATWSTLPALEKNVFRRLARMEHAKYRLECQQQRQQKQVVVPTPAPAPAACSSGTRMGPPSTATTTMWATAPFRPLEHHSSAGSGDGSGSGDIVTGSEGGGGSTISPWQQGNSVPLSFQNPVEYQPQGGIVVLPPLPQQPWSSSSFHHKMW